MKLTFARPPAAFLNAHGWRSSTGASEADTAAGCTPGRPGAWSSGGGSSHEAHRQSDLFRGSAGPGERALNAKSLTLSQLLFEMLRRAPAPRRADSGETAPVASPARRRHQRSGEQPSRSVLAKLLPPQPQAHRNGQSVGGRKRRTNVGTPVTDDLGVVFEPFLLVGIPSLTLEQQSSIVTALF